MKKYDILIIGGGAAGLAAAVSARKTNKNISVGVAEKNDRVARKIHATGNGRCNFTNADMTEDCFFGDRDFIKKVLEQFGYSDALSFFSDLGVMHRTEEGRAYPLSNQASAVADSLRLYLNENNVDFILNTCINDLKKSENGFSACGIFAKQVIVATGGKSSPNFGSDGSGYAVLKALGHTVTKIKPALVSLKTNTEMTKSLKGVKVFAEVKLSDGKKIIAEDRGELLFTDYGVSGIPVMQISRFAEKGMHILIDMLPDVSLDEVTGEIYRRITLLPEREGGELFSGIVNKKIAVPMLKYAKLEKISVKAKDFTDENILKCGEFLKMLKLTVTGDNGFNNAQASAGGVMLCEFSPYTMESRLVPGLYTAGEILDCDGICGGYNLHWAWASGYIAGKAAAGKQLCEVKP